MYVYTKKNNKEKYIYICTIIISVNVLCKKSAGLHPYEHGSRCTAACWLSLFPSFPADVSGRARPVPGAVLRQAQSGRSPTQHRHRDTNYNGTERMGGFSRSALTTTLRCNLPEAYFKKT